MELNESVSTTRSSIILLLKMAVLPWKTFSYAWAFTFTLLSLFQRANAAENHVPDKCSNGLLLPTWEPQNDISDPDKVARGIAYFLAMLYMFIGVSIVSDRFMAAIEVITSKEKEVKVKKPNGEVQIVVVRVWNETVANLTLMALGSSAPEILLSIIEIMGNHFESGDLGPGTIVGSAAFNLLIIIAICVYVIPTGEVRKIKHLWVFFVTATWSVFAYIWLLIILTVSSKGIVEFWEALVTFLFFFATVITAYIADRRLVIYKYLNKGYRVNKRGLIVEGEAAGGNDKRVSQTGLKVFDEEHEDDEVREFEQSRRDYIQLLRDLRKKNPNADTDQLESLAREDILSKGPKSRAFYRIQATRKLVGGLNPVKKMQDKVTSEAIAETTEGDEHPKGAHIISVFFNPGHYTVMENVGSFDATVSRRGGDLSLKVLVDYKSEDGTATVEDYKPVRGTLTFGPGEKHKTIRVEVIDDDVFEEDEHFYIRLSNARFAQPVGAGSGSTPPEVQLVSPFLATVMILDDDHCGIFNLGENKLEIVESIGTLELKVSRCSGARGKVGVPYLTVEGTAKAGKEFQAMEGELIFENNETEKFISIPIIEEESYEKDVVFYVELMPPIPMGDGSPAASLINKKKEDLTKEQKIAMEGWPKLGKCYRTEIHVKESKEFKNTVDKLVQRANASFLVGTSSWKEQFLEAVAVNGGGIDESDEDAKFPSCLDYVMHYLTILWKVIFALIPPTDLCGGYLTFVFSIGGIGIMTAVIGDLANHMGCSIGLKDTVTAVLFVALGTSIPDTFASKVAAVQDEFADASVGNVTGSNAVNVFLGIGIAWTIAAVYHQFIKDCPKAKTPCYFEVDPGSLAFSVTLFCLCAGVAISVMLLRRMTIFGGGELGGPMRFKLPTSILFVCLWIFYVVMSSLEAYNIVKGF